jgi:octaprenyl-diphosphate synthase
MRTHADLASTARRLLRAADNGPAAAVTASRLAALKVQVGEVIARVESALPGAAAGGPGVAGQAAQHLLSAGGKRVRPLLVVLAARACGGSRVGAGHGERAEVQLAQAAELVHAATLLHDDVLDDGRMRRGLPAARMLWGNAASVLGGDFLLVRALELTAGSAVPGALDELLVAIAHMIDGEALQLAHRGRADLDADAYRQVVDGKTAALFAWCGRAGARLAGAGDATIEALGRYGLHLGRAFQIVDDVLDLESDPDELGKDVLSDLREGKLTLPVLLALEGEPLLRARLIACAEAEQPADVEALAGALAQAAHRCGAIDRARAHAAQETAQACDALADLDVPVGARFREALLTIAEELCARVV